MTPIASTVSTTVDTGMGGIFDDHAVDDDDEPWLSETDDKSNWNTRFQRGTYRGVLYVVVLRDSPKQVVSLIKVESMPANMREFLSWTQRHYRIDATTSTLRRKTGQPTFVDPCLCGCKEFPP